MGNKLSCNCGPENNNNGKKNYKYEDTPWAASGSGNIRTTAKRDGHLLRLWAEVFHVTSGGGGSIKWQQVSEDLVPVNITCIQDSPEIVFHITAYNSQVDKILDVRLVQPGTRIGQASECFVYWKDPVTSDTYGLNFTSNMDAKQFREICSANFKLTRKASSSYSLRNENNLKTARSGVVNGVNSLSSSRGGSGRLNQMVGEKRRPMSTSTPTSPSKSREPQCTCMTAEQYARLRAMDPRFRAASTLPKSLHHQASIESGAKSDGETIGMNVRKMRSSGRTQREILASKSVDYSQEHHHNQVMGTQSLKIDKKQKSRSKSTEDVNKQHMAGPSAVALGGPGDLQYIGSKIPDHNAHLEAVKRSNNLIRSKMQTRTTIGTNTTPVDLNEDLRGDNYSLKRRLKTLSGSVSTSPEVSRKIYCHDGYISEPESRHAKLHIIHDTRGKDKRRGVGTQTANIISTKIATSPPSDHPVFDHAYYATTPSSSPETEDNRGRGSQSGSPTARLLLEYEQHLRNTLAKGLDAENYSFNTFEAILSKSNENLAQIPQQGMPMSRSTLPRIGMLNQMSMPPMSSRDQRYFDTVKDFNRDRGYLSDHDSRTNGFFDQMNMQGPSGGRSGYCSDREMRGGIGSGYFSDRDNAQSKYGPIRQHSFESADSRLCYLTSSEISDDERMSLTTAVSDEDGAVDGSTSPKARKSASFNCTGAVRKAGFLSVKKWLLRKRHQIELAKRRGWKGYWVALKGTTLLFYPCDGRESRSVEAAPKHLIIVDGAIMQPIPEHPKRDYIFCLSTAFGDAYLFQAPCQVELESWVHSIHWSCAAAFARHRGKTGTLHLLQEEIVRLDKSIESDGKLRHMAELQRSVVADPETRSQLAQQISSWEENIERLHCEQFRLRCYMTSLQIGELPNPKSLLSHVSRTTKNILNRLGVFTVSSFHAYVCARSPSLLSNLLAGRGATKRRAPLLSRSNSSTSRRSLHANDLKEGEKHYKVSLPDNQIVTVPLREEMSVEEFLVHACSKKNLSPMEHFLRVKKRKELPDTNYFVPHRNDLVESYLPTHEVIEVRAKLLYQVEIARNALDCMWGFSVEAELVENSDRQDELCCYVSRVEDKSVAMNNGIIKGDEILVINGAIVSDLDMMFIESVLQEELSLCLMLRSSRTEQPAMFNPALAAADAAIANLVCPPPPSDTVLTDDALINLIVPAPQHQGKEMSPSDTEDNVRSGRNSRAEIRADSNDIENLVKSAGEITGFCRFPDTAGPIAEGSPLVYSNGNSPTHINNTHGLSDVEKMKKIVQELIETERSYVKHLTCLLEQYLEPLKYENFLSTTEILAIFGNTKEIVNMQKQFLKSLEYAIQIEDPSFTTFTQTYEFKNILQNIAMSFLNFADHFKLYSSFCASHSKAQKLLHPTEGNQALQQFLISKNPRQQHSNTLESYLIKPIQRILKYPLLLQQLRNLCDTNTDEYQSLVECLQCMERVAEHINEMQRIHEEYGAIFEHLFRQHQKQCKSDIELSPGDLIHYGGVEWLNIADFLGKIKKGLELHAMCFVFKSAVVFLCKERLRHKRKLMGSTSRGITDKSEVEIIRYQVLIPVSEVQVRQVGSKNSDDESGPQIQIGPNYSWELVHLRNQAQRRTEKIYFLSNSTAEFRNAFLKNIRQIIRDSVRNMTLPKFGDSGNPYATPEGLEYAEVSAKPHHPHRNQAQTLGRKKPPKPPQRNSAGNLEVGSAKMRPVTSGGQQMGPQIVDSDRFRVRSKTMSDTKRGGGSSFDENDPPAGAQHSLTISGGSSLPRKKGILGTTPNHLSLSTTSTISGGSTGSAAKLIISSTNSGKPPPSLPEPTSPIWKPREGSFEGELPKPASDDKKDEPKPGPSSGASASGSGHEKEKATKSETHTKKSHK